jgi:magnesium chelatase subunit I
VPLPATIAELRATGFPDRSVKEELRANLLERLGSGAPLFPQVVGFGDSVLPVLERGLLAGHDLVMLGERGQAKTRLIRQIVELLDEQTPAIAGCEVNDHPYHPICAACRALLAEDGDAAPIRWIGREDRYAEKLATPDTSVADLIGDVDPIRVAEGRYLADELTIHYGMIPRTNRGIVAINELPDLPERIQVALFNILEERDVQIRGYRIRLPLDLLLVATANPDDYTHRGRIVSPLKDRFGTQVRTHYPESLEDEIAIMEQEVPLRDTGERPLRVPPFLKEILAQLTMEARASSEINQSSGVSVRVTINNYESILSNAEKRALKLHEPEIVPRLSDLPSLFASTAGKIEIEYVGEDVKEEDVIERLLNRAILKVFDTYVKTEDLKKAIEYFEQGWGVEVSDAMPSEEYREGIRAIPGLREGILALGSFESPGLMASAAEFLLEGLHLHQKLNKEQEGGRYVYRA